jgi:hypothetical protein
MSQTTNSLWTKFTETVHGKDEVRPYVSTETSSNKRASCDYHTGCTREQPHGDHTGRTMHTATTRGGRGEGSEAVRGGVLTTGTM